MQHLLCYRKNVPCTKVCRAGRDRDRQRWSEKDRVRDREIERVREGSETESEAEKVDENFAVSTKFYGIKRRLYKVQSMLYTCRYGTCCRSALGYSV